MAIALLFLLASCGLKDSNVTKREPLPAGLFATWLTAHGERNMEITNNVITVQPSGVKLQGSILEGTSEPDFNTVELELRATLPDGRQIIEYPGGSGTTREAARDDAVDNLCESTIHPIFAAFINHNDPHVNKQEWKIDGKNRTVYLGSVSVYAPHKPDEKLKDILTEIFKRRISGMRMNKEAHWAKLVLWEKDGKVDAEMTFDNVIDGDGADAIKEEWPKQNGAFRLKQFLLGAEH